MPAEHPHLPEPDPVQKRASGAREEGAVSARQDATMTASLLTTFTRAGGENPEQARERFIDEVIIPALERGPLPDASALVTEITDVLERGMPTVPQAQEWSLRALASVERTTRVLSAIQRSTGEILGPAGAFAMAEIAHHCPKFLHMVVATVCDALSQALDRGDAEGAESHRKTILQELGGTAPMPATERFETLLRRYSISQEDFRLQFQAAESGLTQPGNFEAISAQLTRRFNAVIRDVLGLDEHAYEIAYVTNIREAEHCEDIIPRGGLVVEVLTELITNALKVMEQTGNGSQIVVSVHRRQDGSVLLKVRDDGPGIGDKDPEELFSAGQTTTQRFGGTGMGLTFLRQNIQKHFQGFLTAQNNPGGTPGLTVSCILPPAEGWPHQADDV